MEWSIDWLIEMIFLHTFSPPSSLILFLFSSLCVSSSVRPSSWRFCPHALCLHAQQPAVPSTLGTISFLTLRFVALSALRHGIALILDHAICAHVSVYYSSQRVVVNVHTSATDSFCAEVLTLQLSWLRSFLIAPCLQTNTSTVFN